MRGWRVTPHPDTRGTGPRRRASRRARRSGRLPAALLACATLGVPGCAPEDRGTPPPRPGQDGVAVGVGRRPVVPAAPMHRFRVGVEVTTDAAGAARVVRFAADDLKHMEDDPEFRDVARRVARAVLDPRCAPWPLPRRMLGRPRTIRLLVRP